MGVLKEWLVRTLAAVLSRGATKITLRDLTAQALTISQCEKMLAEVTEGEARMTESDGARSRFRLALGLPAIDADQGRTKGISTSRVYCLHGDLARAIAARHLKERVESMERQRELLRIEVFAIVKDMLDRGERPVQSRVQKLLSADSLKARRTLGRCLNEATRNLMNTQTEEVR